MTPPPLMVSARAAPSITPPTESRLVRALGSLILRRVQQYVTYNNPSCNVSLASHDGLVTWMINCPDNGNGMAAGPVAPKATASHKDSSAVR